MNSPSTLTISQTQLLLGTMLGDGHMKRHKTGARFSSRHGWGQHDYNLHKYHTLKDFVATPPSKQKNDGYGAWTSAFSTLVCPAFVSIAELCLNSRGQKQVNQAWLDQITWEGIAWWILDDGSLIGRRAFHIHTEGFTELEQNLLVEWLQARGVSCRVAAVTRTKDQKTYNYILVDGEGTRFLAENIKPFVPASMAYKIDLQQRISTVRCVFCDTEFEITKPGVSRNPNKPPKHGYCCTKSECRLKRRRAVVKKHDQSESAKARRAIWLEKNKERTRIYMREYARKRRAEAKSSKTS